MTTRTLNILAGALLAAGLTATAAQAGPWTSYPVIYEPPTLGVPAGPIVHPGKEYMMEINRNADLTPNPGQVVAWDGNGGVQNSQINYNNNTNTPHVNVERVDALANHGDAYFNEVVSNRTALLYSERTPTPGLGDAWGKGSDTAYPVYYETANGGRGGWATRQQVNQHWTPQAEAGLNAQGQGLNLIGLEVFGPNSPNGDDSDMFSVNGDVALLPDGVRYSVYSYVAGNIRGYLSVQTVATALSAFYNVPYNLIEPLIDLDAMMVQDDGDFIWDSGDRVLLSLMPANVSGFSYVGDSAYVLDFGQPLANLNHGGHFWSNNWLGTNVDALEAAIPEPASLALLGIGLLGLVGARYRRV